LNKEERICRNKKDSLSTFLLSKIEDKSRKKYCVEFSVCSVFNMRIYLFRQVEKCRYFLLSFEYTLMNYLLDFKPDSTQPRKFWWKKNLQQTVSIFYLSRDWLNSEEIIRLLCCASSGKSYHLLYGKITFSIISELILIIVEGFFILHFFRSTLFFSSRLSSFFALLFSVQ
jgi:hypothetical protein